MVIPERTRSDVTREGAKEGAPSPARREVSYSNPSPADRIRALIQQAGMSQRGAARELDVDERTVRYWCSGQVEPPRMAFLALERLIELGRTVSDK